MYISLKKEDKAAAKEIMRKNTKSEVKLRGGRRWAAGGGGAKEII